MILVFIGYVSLLVSEFVPVVKKYRLSHCILSDSFLGRFLKNATSDFMLVENNLHLIYNRILLIVFLFGITAGKITWANTSPVPFTRGLVVKGN